MCVVVLVTPSLTYVLFGSLREGVPVTDKVSQLPGYLSDTFLHLDFGYAPTQGAEEHEGQRWRDQYDDHHGSDAPRDERPERCPCPLQGRDAISAELTIV